MRRAGMAAVLAMLAGAGAARADGDHLAATPPVGPQSVLADSIRYAAKVTDNNLINVTITNYGFLGNNFVANAGASFQYPAGTGHEHMVRGGLWIGANAQSDTGNYISVVTGAVDGSQGSSAQLATEFTPAGTQITALSTLRNNSVYSPKAKSELDLISEYSDMPAKRASGNAEDHKPLKILVKQENYMWSFSRYQNLIAFRFTITNTGPPLTDAWVGMYAELASGPRNSYSSWPPASAGGGPLGGWFSHKWMQYDDSLRMIREHYCFSSPIPAGCNLERVPEWVGIKVLGTQPEPVSTKTMTMAAWAYSPGNSLRDEDTERYAIMSAGGATDLADPTLVPPGDPVELIAVGPFAQINNGQSIVVDFALVGGAGLADPFEIQENSRFAQRAYDNGYVVPVPPPSPRLKVVARDGALDLYWDKTPEAFADTTGPYPLDFEGYRIYVGEDRNNLQRIAQFDLATAPHDTVGFNTGLPPRQCWEIDDNHGVPIHCEDFPGAPDGDEYDYKYTIPRLRNGFKYFVAVTAYDLGTDEIESLESGIAQNKTEAIPGPAPGERPHGQVTVYPNPYRVEARWDQGRQVRDHYLWFTNLPPSCTIRIYTLSGDLVFETPFTGSAYHGENARGVYDPNSEIDVEPPTLSGTTFAWNMITRLGQAAATGLYIYSVEDASTKKSSVGKFLIVKSDREGF